MVSFTSSSQLVQIKPSCLITRFSLSLKQILITYILLVLDLLLILIR
nr:MAG TPA: hypothetical protein [Caudoviricetes sp.]